MTCTSDEAFHGKLSICGRHGGSDIESSHAQSCLGETDFHSFFL